jgi:salicylate hydroxylase
MRERHGAPFVDVHRGQLQLLLYNRALALGVDIQLGATVQSVNHQIGEVFLDSGKSYRGELVVGADGLWSVCRQSLLQEQVLPQPTGDLAYRITLTLDQVSDHELRSMIQNAACHLWIGPNSHVVAYSMKAGTMYNIVLLVPDDLPPHVAKQNGDIDEMKALFRDWDPLLSRFLNMVDSVQKWKLMHLPELETWRNGKGNFILLGDSCHPMLPYLAQGANSAIEDGAVLGAILSAVTSSSQIAQATEIWQSLRKKRSEFLVNESYAQVIPSSYPFLY